MSQNLPKGVQEIKTLEDFIKVPKTKMCPKCEVISAEAETLCPWCGYAFPKGESK